MIWVFLGVASGAFLMDLELDAGQARRLSLNRVDVVFVNTFGHSSENVTFKLTPQMDPSLELKRDVGYLFRGESLQVASATGTKLKLWILPKGLCSVNSYLISPDFTLSFVAESFSEFCLFTPLDFGDSVFQFQMERFSEKAGAFMVLESNATEAVPVADKSLYDSRSPYVFVGKDNALVSGLFSFEVNAVRFGKCAAEPIIDASGTGLNAQTITPKCSNLKAGAFSLELAAPSAIVFGIGTGWFLTKRKWVDWRKLFGFDEVAATETQPREPVEELREGGREEPLLTIDEAL